MFKLSFGAAEVSRPVKESHGRTSCLGQFHRTICGAGIDDDDFFSQISYGGDRVLDEFFFVLDDHAHGKRRPVHLISLGKPILNGLMN